MTFLRILGNLFLILPIVRIFCTSITLGSVKLKEGVVLSDTTLKYMFSAFCNIFQKSIWLSMEFSMNF
jgi:hypothetical protein